MKNKLCIIKKITNSVLFQVTSGLSPDSSRFTPEVKPKINRNKTLSLFSENYLSPAKSFLDSDIDSNMKHMSAKSFIPFKL